MATNKRMTAKDYRKELSDLQKQQNVLEARIRNRASELCEKYPDVVIGTEYGKTNSNERIFAGQYKGFLISCASVDIALTIIETIEKYLADKHPHKQTTIEFPNN